MSKEEVRDQIMKIWSRESLGMTVEDAIELAEQLEEDFSASADALRTDKML